MIITITGKPCSGKGTTGKILAEKYNFDYICTGDIFRRLALENGYKNILDFEKNSDIKKVDKMVDDKTIEIGHTRFNDNIIFDSRLAWNFIPNSFKVFIDIDWETAGKRLLEANRNSEKFSNIDEAVKSLKERWEVENKRFMELYNTNNLNPDNYDLIISSSNKSPEEIAEIIYDNYKKFMLKA